MPIDFVEMLHGESLETMDSTEKLLCKHRLNVCSLEIYYIAKKLFSLDGLNSKEFMPIFQYR